MSRPSWTIAEAAERCGVSRSTVRRYRESGRFPNAYKDPFGVWKIPLPDLLAVGWKVVDPSADTPDVEAPATDVRVVELEAELAVERAKREAAERVAAMAETHLEDMRRALRMLEGAKPMDPVSEPEPPAEPVLSAPADVPPNNPMEPPRRRWWHW